MLQQNKGCSFLCGPVAQLGARFHGMEEVIGSIPIRSTNQFNKLDGKSRVPSRLRGISFALHFGGRRAWPAMLDAP
jgi:hypothetical protein